MYRSPFCVLGFAKLRRPQQYICICSLPSVTFPEIHKSQRFCFEQVPNASPTAASASSDMYGGAATDACAQLNQRLQPYRDQLSGKPFAVRCRPYRAMSACSAPPPHPAWSVLGLLQISNSVFPAHRLTPTGSCSYPTTAQHFWTLVSPSRICAISARADVPGVQDVVMAAHLDRVDLSAHGFYKTPDVTGFGGKM